MDTKFYKQCQSCGLPLENGAKSGSEVDGRASLKYCNLCYKDGAFIEPDMTIERMRSITEEVLKQKGWILPMRWMAKMQIPRLERWKK